MIRIALWAFALLATGAQGCVLNIAYNALPSPPLYLGEGPLIPDHPGIGVELVSMAAERMGCSVKWQRAPQKRLQRMLDDGDIDANLALSYNTERARQYAFPMKGPQPDSTLALATLTYFFYVPSGSTLRWNGKKFNRPTASVGANAGFSIVRDLAQLGITVDEAPGEINNLKKLQNKRIEAFAGQDARVEPLLAQAEFSGIERLTPAIARKNYFLAFSKAYFSRSPEIANRLWREIGEVSKVHGKRLEQKYATH